MPRTTIDLDKGNYNRLRQYCQTKHISMREATNNLLSQALAMPGLQKKEKVDLPVFPIGIRINPGDREALFNAMGERQ